jgi:hypothetical protein
MSVSATAAMTCQVRTEVSADHQCFRPHLLSRSTGLLIELVSSRADAALREALHLRLRLRRKLIGCRLQLTLRELRAGNTTSAVSE